VAGDSRRWASGADSSGDLRAGGAEKKLQNKANFVSPHTAAESNEQ
jgi:hypothetical protein